MVADALSGQMTWTLLLLKGGKKVLQAESHVTVKQFCHKQTCSEPSWKQIRAETPGVLVGCLLHANEVRNSNYFLFYAMHTDMYTTFF